MRKIIICILLVVFLCSCSADTLSLDQSTMYQYNNTSSNLNDQNNISKTVENGKIEFPLKSSRSYEVFEDNSTENEFDQAMIQNPIDQKMYAELKTADLSGTRESQVFFDSYVKIWKTELSFSMDNLITYLSAEEADKLETAQSYWEESWKSNSEFDTFLIGEKGIDLGTQSVPSGLINLIDQYRDRVFHIKYMTLLVEEYVENPIPSNQCLWKKFSIE